MLHYTYCYCHLLYCKGHHNISDSLIKITAANITIKMDVNIMCYMLIISDQYHWWYTNVPSSSTNVLNKFFHHIMLNMLRINQFFDV